MAALEKKMHFFASFHDNDLCFVFSFATLGFPWDLILWDFRPLEGHIALTKCEKREKIVKVCLHSGLAVQMSLQFDEFIGNITKDEKFVKNLFPFAWNSYAAQVFVILSKQV